MVGAVVRSWVSLLCVIGVAAAAAAGAPAATAATLSGTVSGQTASAPSQPIAGAVVSVVDGDTGIAIASAVTDATGSYSVAVPSGVYDVHVAPAPAQMLAPTVVPDVDLNADRRLDVVLVPAGAVRLSGVVRDAGGAPLEGVRVGLTTWGSPSMVTDAEGRYGLVLSPRPDARLRVESIELVDGMPRRWEVTSAEFSLLADEARDVRLPEVRRVSVRVLDESGVPLEGATVRLPELRGAQEQLGDLVGRVDTAVGEPLMTGSDGVAAFETFGGDPQGSGSVSPAAGSGYGSASFTFETVVGDAVVEVRPPRAVRLSGVVRDAGGAPVEGVRVGLTTWGSPSVVTDAEGRYDLVLSPRSEAWLSVEGSEAGGLQGRWQVSSEAFALTTDQVRDVRLPEVRRVSVRVLDESGVPLEGATVRLPELRGVQEQLGDLVGRVDTAVLEQEVTGSDGVAAFDTFGGNPQGSGSVAPAAGSGYGSASFTFGTVTGAVTVDVRPPRAVRMSGVVRDAAGAPVEGVRVGLTSRGAPEVMTDAAGGYGFVVSPRPEARLGVRSVEELDGFPQLWNVTTDAFPLLADEVVDVRLPSVRRVSVRVLGSDGEPLEGATVRLPELRGVQEQLGDLAGRVDTGQLSAVTGDDGTAAFDTFGGSAQSNGTVVPPPGSELANARFPIATVLSDTTILVRFQDGTDVLPPAVECAQPPAGWIADEAVVHCTASDFPSGLADPADAEFDLTTAVGDGNEDAAALTGSHEVCDLASNCATAGPFGPFQVDRQAPRIRFEHQPNGLQGWFVDPPGSVTAVAEDANVASLDCALAGVPAGQPPQPAPGALSLTLSAAGEGRHQVDCTASDEAGHSSSASGAILIDRTRPLRPTAAADRQPDYAGRGGWYRDAVTVSFADRGDPDLADGNPGSGIDAETSTQPQTISQSGVHTVEGFVADVAGNRSLERSLTVRVDADPPRSDLSCPATVRRGLPGFARWTDRYEESGIGGLPVGLALLDSSTLGSHSFSHTAVDNVGHSTTVTCTYTVIPLFG